MSRNMNEYKKSMENIVPSESFISETEALMKQALAQKRAGSISSDKKRSKITVRTTAAFSAAAAVFICIAAAGVYNNSHVDSGIVTEETVTTAETIAETVTETDTVVVSETASDTEILSDIENDLPVIANEYSQENVPVTEAAYDETTAVTSADEAIEEEIEEEAAPVSFTAEMITTEQNVPDTESTVTEQITEMSAAEISVTENVITEDIIAVHDFVEYDDAQVEAEEAYDEGSADSSGAPLYVPPLDGYSYDSIDQEEAVEEEADESIAIPMTLSLRSYDPEMFSAVNEVYVPDYVTDLDSGSYSMTLTAGYDEFDEETGAVISGGEVYLSSDMISYNENIINTLSNVTGNSPSSHMDKESEMNNYRYKIAVNSALEDEDNALMFEITYDENVMIINRYDNGTVSSERYELSETDYNDIDTVLSSLF
ncbi:MAG: hypothetical protein IJ446_10410 [Oscillospiraceae bacterium]|nr:hypothetical protein [Oscillospiraceae bacterium]